MSKLFFTALVASLLATLTLAAPSITRIPKIPGYRLLAISETQPPFWVPIEVAETLGNGDINFIDITDFQDANPALAPKVADIPTGPTHQSVVNPLIRQIDSSLYEKNLVFFSSFQNRYYTSDFGVQSSSWIFDQASSIASNRSDITISRFSHTFKQPSVIAKIAGTSSDEIIILGAHQDSISSNNMPTGSAPGADDDGTGSMGILEIFRVLVEANFRPERSIEFHWYAAEEVGLLGSQAIAKEYQANDAPVYAMMQLDMIGYNGKESTVGIVTDYVDASTIAFNRKLVTEYLDIGYTNTVCGYGCSDHASWNRYGYRSSFPFEAQFSNRNSYIHTVNDVTSRISTEHAAEFIKLGLAFAIELSYL